MKRRFLEDLGLTKEQVDSIMTENGADIENAKADYEALKTQLEAQKNQIEERDRQLEDLKKNAGNSEALQKQIADLQADNLAARTQYESDMKDLRISSAIKLALGDSAQDADLVAGLFDKGKLILSEDGKVTGLDEQLKDLKKEKAFLFKAEQKPSATFKGGKPAEGSAEPPTDKKPSEMTYSEMTAYLEANPGAKLD